MPASANPRPSPPPEILDRLAVAAFVPAPEVAEWAEATFLDEASKLHNPDHAHLAHAEIGFLWTNVPNGRNMRTVIGQCEVGTPRAMGKWAKARAELQITDWFGRVPDFIITLDASYCVQASDAEFCALVEHEMYHAGQERDEFGQPKFTQSGRPKFGIRGHDVEEFIGVVRRYGAISHEVQAMVQAASKRPEVASVHVAQACGTCQLRVA